MNSGALLLDLDGTLVDTAPDMVTSLNRLLHELGAAEVPFAAARGHVSNGVAGLLGVALGLTVDDPRLPAMRQRYLEIYAEFLAVNSNIFNGFSDVFEVISHSGWPWGVVTNKPQHLARPLLLALELRPPQDCIVGGDTLSRCKPDPAPLLHAAQVLATPPQRCIYVGDAARDIEAGRAAGMRTVAARYGYLQDPAEADSWHADHIIDSPAELAELLRCLAAEMARAG